MMSTQLQTVVEYILAKSLSAVDSVGVLDTDLCGGDQLDSFLISARDLARHLTTIRKAKLRTALDCDRMNPVYVDLLFDSCC
jgi:hypothetical protein